MVESVIKYVKNSLPLTLLKMSANKNVTLVL